MPDHRSERVGTGPAKLTTGTAPPAPMEVAEDEVEPFDDIFGGGDLEELCRELRDRLLPELLDLWSLLLRDELLDDRSLLELRLLDDEDEE